MLRIKSKVLTYDGNQIASGVVVNFNPNFQAMSPVMDNTKVPPVATGVNLPCSLSFYISQDIQAAGYRNIVPIVDDLKRQPIDIVNVVMTVLESQNPTKSIIEGYIKTALELVYGSGNVEIIA